MPRVFHPSLALASFPDDVAPLVARNGRLDLAFLFFFPPETSVRSILRHVAYSMHRRRRAAARRRGPTPSLTDAVAPRRAARSDLIYVRNLHGC